MALKIFFWTVILAYGILAVVCFGLSASWLCAGMIADCCIIGWVGLIPAAATAFAWWAKNQLEEMSNESRP